MTKKGMEAKIILEGEAVTLVPIMADPGHFLHPLYRQARQEGLIIGACRACSHKLQVTDLVAKEEIPLIGEMSGHPAISTYIESGYTLLTF